MAYRSYASASPAGSPATMAATTSGSSMRQYRSSATHSGQSECDNPIGGNGQQVGIDGLLPGRSYLLLAHVTRVTYVTCSGDRVLGHVAGRAETIIMAALGAPRSRRDAPACSDTRACHGAFGPARIGVDRGLGLILCTIGRVAELSRRGSWLSAAPAWSRVAGLWWQRGRLVPGVEGAWSLPGAAGETGSGHAGLAG